MLALPTDAQLWVFLLLGAAELGIPVVAERALPEPPFHAEHIEERYGLFTIILLGESVLSAAAGLPGRGRRRRADRGTARRRPRQPADRVRRVVAVLRQSRAPRAHAAGGVPLGLRAHRGVRLARRDRRRAAPRRVVTGSRLRRSTPARPRSPWPSPSPATSSVWPCCCASSATASAAPGSGPSWPGRPRPRRSARWRTFRSPSSAAGWCSPGSRRRWSSSTSPPEAADSGRRSLESADER